jgi:hypothetical protein
MHPMPVNALFSFLIKKRLQQIELFRDHPHEAQLEVFHQLDQHGALHRMGTPVRFQSIATPDQFRERVPLQDYNDVKPYVDRMRGGNRTCCGPRT